LLWWVFVYLVWKGYQMYRKHIKNIDLFFLWKWFIAIHETTFMFTDILHFHMYMHWLNYCTGSTSQHATIKITLLHYKSHKLCYKYVINYMITQSHNKPHKTVFTKIVNYKITLHINFIFNLIDAFVWTYYIIIVYLCMFYRFCIILLFHSIFLYETCLIRTSMWLKLVFRIEMCMINIGILINLLLRFYWSPILFI
jgi:hypothetical protein